MNDATREKATAAATAAIAAWRRGLVRAPAADAAVIDQVTSAATIEAPAAAAIIDQGQALSVTPAEAQPASATIDQAASSPPDPSAAGAASDVSVELGVSLEPDGAAQVAGGKPRKGKATRAGSAAAAADSLAADSLSVGGRGETRIASESAGIPAQPGRDEIQKSGGSSQPTVAVLDAAQRKVLEEVLARRRALESLPEFVRYLRQRGVDSRYFAHDVHPVQAPLIAAAEALARGEEKAVTISCPPSLSKSTVFSIWLPLFLLARDPRTRIICTSHTDGIVQLFARERRKIMCSEAWRVLAGTDPVDAQGAADTFAVTAGGSIISRSANASVTGLRADVIIGDDLVSGSDEARSAPQLEALWTWVQQDLLTRRDDSRSRFAIIGTRWSVSDPIGKLQKLSDAGEMTVHHVRIPMICDDEENDPLGRKLGAWIEWPGRFDDPEQRAQWQRSPLMWSSLYMQRPFDAAGGFCPPGAVTIRELPPIAGRPALGVDFAMTDSSRADYTAMAIGVAHLNENGEAALCITDYWQGQRNPRDVAAQVVTFCAQHKPQRFATETDGATKVYLSAALPGEFARRAVPMPTIDKLSHAGAAKEVRASPLRGLIERGLFSIVRAPWNQDLLDQLYNFPAAGVPDDGVDAVANIARIFDRLSYGMKPEGAKPPPPPILGFVIPDENNPTRGAYYRASMDEMWEDNDRGKSAYSARRLP